MPQETCSSNYTFLTESGLLSTHCSLISKFVGIGIIPFLVYIAKKQEILFRAFQKRFEIHSTKFLIWRGLSKLDVFKKVRRAKVMEMYNEAQNLETSRDKIEKLTKLVDYLISELQKNGLI